MSNFRSRIVSERTLGDGMDRCDLEMNEDSKSKFNFSIPQKPSPSILRSMRPIIPTTKIFKTIPKYIPNERRHPKYLIRKPKEPKFIPYEPYKGAVQPITPRKRKPIVVKTSKNNIEIQDLVSQMSDLRTAELAKSNVENEDIVISKKEWEKEKQNYQNDIKNLRESNSVLENQLKLQTQVNSELKTLLVAAVGEDLETRVQHLTEDKLQLARALLNSANHLTTHQEQIEWLSGQCEVWRSKFLASSLMVEELAKWKSVLTIRLRELQSVLSKILEDQRQVHRTSIRTAYNLNRLSQHFGNAIDKVKSLESTDINILSTANFEVSQDLCNKFFPYDEEAFGKFYNKIMDIPHRSWCEEKLRKILQDPLTISVNQDELCKAVLEEADTAANEQTIPSTSTCCPHCTGQFKVI
ncbi:hypothetical protein WA026_011369 [Henosepilachna vigintioctopunctata]|uniref:Golgin-45 n=1 Tax=Henosepilachna vigintioctopunctata TaxID=420089 RepID=A0AAW1TTG4_9CUCU